MNAGILNHNHLTLQPLFHPACTAVDTTSSHSTVGTEPQSHCIMNRVPLTRQSCNYSNCQEKKLLAAVISAVKSPSCLVRYQDQSRGRRGGWREKKRELWSCQKRVIQPNTSPFFMLCQQFIHFYMKSFNTTSWVTGKNHFAANICSEIHSVCLCLANS